MAKTGSGKAYVSVNKALVTQASSAIPVVPLYVSILYKIMTAKGTHEGCIEQTCRLFKDRLYGESKISVDEEQRIRLDDWEMDPEVQQKIIEIWPHVNTGNLSELTDFEWRDGYIFEKCQCTGTWVGDDDFFFCQWESENEEDVLKALTSKGMDKYIFTALYPIDMQIDIRNLTGKVPYGPIFYLDDEYNPEN